MPINKEYDDALQNGYEAVRKTLARAMAKGGGKLDESTVSKAIDEGFDTIMDEFESKIPETELLSAVQAYSEKIRSAFVPKKIDEIKEEDLPIDEWIALQDKKVIEIIVGFEVKLQAKRYEKKKIPVDEQRNIEAEFSDSFTEILKQSRIREKLSADPAEIAKYQAFNTDLKTKIGDFIEDWGLSEHTQKTELMDVDKMSPKEVIDYTIEKELKFWEGIDVDADDEFVRKLMHKLKWDMGWETNAVREGTCGGGPGEYDDYWASLEGREQMVRLQLAGLYALVLRGKPFAEGDRTKLFESLDRMKLSREQLILATTANPTIGKYLSKILEICQELPILRTGKLPDRGRWGHGPGQYDVNTGLDRTRRDDDGNIILENGVAKIFPLNDRVVIRNGKKVLLHGDILNDSSDEETSRFVNGEPMLPTDRLFIEADKRFDYVSLSGNIGKEQAKLMRRTITKMISDDPEKYGLLQSDITHDDERLKLIGYYADTLFYAFPFLTYILAKSQERTQTASHNKDLEEKVDWGLVFSPMGKAIHDSKRYGDFVSWMWLLIYYKDLPEGRFGAGGDAAKLNEFRKLLVAHQRALFGKDVVDSFTGKVDVLETFDEPEFLSPYKMLTLSPEERSSLRGHSGHIGYGENKVAENSVVDLRDANNALIKGTLEQPYMVKPDNAKPGKGIEARSFELMNVAISGWLKLLEGIIGGIQTGSVTSETLRGKGNKKGDVGELLGVIAGTVKMFETEWRNMGETVNGVTKYPDVLEGFIKYPMFHKILRLFHASKSNDFDGREKMFQALENQLLAAATTGGLSSGHAKEMTLWILDRVRGKGDPEKYAASRRYAGMNAGLAPRETLANSRRKDDVIEYLRLLWEFKFKDSKGNILEEFPLDPKGDSIYGFIKPKLWIKAKNNADIMYFSKMALRQLPLEPPLTREGLKTTSSKEDKEE